MLGLEVWELDDVENTMWMQMSGAIKKVGKEILGESIGLSPAGRDTWWWNEEVQKVIKDKRECYKAWYKCKNEDNWVRY